MNVSIISDNFYELSEENLEPIDGGNPYLISLINLNFNYEDAVVISSYVVYKIIT